MKTKKSKPNLCLTCVSGQQNQILTKERKLKQECCHNCLHWSNNIFLSNEPNKPLLVHISSCNKPLGCACCKPFIYNRATEKCHDYQSFELMADTKHD